jgi:hypothetical protein
VGIALTILWFIGETASFFVGKALQSKWVMFAVPIQPKGRHLDYEEYLNIRDPEVGWPYPQEFGNKRYDASGAFRTPAFPDPKQPSCLSIYGDSFARSNSEPSEAWSNLLAVNLRCRVANYGVGGYGSDQALVRFRKNEDDESPVVMLTHLPENITRNLTRNRDLLTYVRWFAYKPRFVLENGTLEHIPIPSLSREEHLRFIGEESPQLELEHESFYPGGPAGAMALKFSYILSMLRNLSDFRLRARLAGRPVHAEFYAKGHELQGMEITKEIFKTFLKEAEARGKTPLVMLFAGKEDIEHFIETKEWYHGPLQDALIKGGAPVLDFGERLVEYVGNRNPGELFDHTGHYTSEGDEVVAEFVYRALEEKGLLPKAERQESGLPPVS